MGTNGVPFFALGGKSSSQSEFRRENSFDVTYRKLRQAPQNYFKKVAFRCGSACETMEDYKEGYLLVWTNYISPCSSIVGLYFKGTCDVISVTMATHKVHKSVL